MQLKNLMLEIWGKKDLAKTTIFQTNTFTLCAFVSWLAKIKPFLPVVPIIMNATLPNNLLRWGSKHPSNIRFTYRGNNHNNAHKQTDKQ